jgi:hypothetical protein
MKNSAQQQDELFARLSKARQAMPARGRGNSPAQPTPPPALVAV